jgi:hypothetical protein
VGKNFAVLNIVLMRYLKTPLHKKIVPGWVSAPQAHSRMSNINFDI